VIAPVQIRTPANPEDREIALPKSRNAAHDNGSRLSEFRTRCPRSRTDRAHGSP
jgi:hypothetical protein